MMRAEMDLGQGVGHHLGIIRLIWRDWQPERSGKEVIHADCHTEFCFHKLSVNCARVGEWLGENRVDMSSHRVLHIVLDAFAYDRD